MEFCGGTHVRNTAEIGLFKITSEASISSGVRRIEAVTGEGVERYIASQLEKIGELSDSIAKLIEEKKTLEKELNKYKLQAATSNVDELIAQAASLNGFRIVSAKIAVSDIEELKSIGDAVRSKIGSGVGVLAAVLNEKVQLVCVVTDDLIKSKNLQAGKIVGEVAKLVGGGGGGRPHLATAGGKDIRKIDEALKQVEEITKTFLK
jgi:alanyl-tRNA synthetase